ncbi:hypothetical protein DL767_000643 [Monosporascus sp. MG133]|nr:hypothetical protein DL767_000643 [Monosporascus sp. MG133]
MPSSLPGPRMAQQGTSSQASSRHTSPAPQARAASQASSRRLSSAPQTRASSQIPSGRSSAAPRPRDPSSRRQSPAPGQPSSRTASPSPAGTGWDLYPGALDVLPHEPLEQYAVGGFHPVTLGDVFQGGRYTVRHKLGWGGQSTVWLAWDSQKGSAKASKDGLARDPELSILKTLEKYYSDTKQTGPRGFVHLLDSFQHKGPNGTHNCIVTELLGPTLSSVLDAYQKAKETLRPDTVLRASRQLLEGLQNFSDGDEDQLFNDMGGPPTVAKYKSSRPRPENLPKHLVKFANWELWYDNDQEDIRLIDWGWSFAVNQTVEQLGQPMNLRAPETFFLQSFDYRHDLWRAGCAIYALLYQKTPFSYYCEQDDFFIRRLVMKLGPLPKAWNAKWEEMLKRNKNAAQDAKDVPKELIQDTFEPRRKAIVNYCDTHPQIYEKDNFSEVDFKGLNDLLKVMQGLMQHEPERRIPLQQAASYIQWKDYRRQ